MMISIGAFLLNLIMFGAQKFGTTVDANVLIIICSVVAGVIGVPLLGFFGFHLWLICKGRTTR